MPQLLKKQKSKKLYIYKIHYPSPAPSVIEIPPGFVKILILRCGPLRGMRFGFDYLGKFKN
jgi:hypothetical protein